MSADAWRPLIEDVALLLATRTRTDSGEEAGTFDDTTTPSADEVVSLTDLALTEVSGHLADLDVAAELDPAVVRLVALRAAALVEISFFRAQGDSPAQQLTAMYLSDLQALLELLRGVPVRLP